MKKNKKVLVYILVLVCVCVVGLISGLLQFLVINPSRNYAYESIQFSYEGASEGKDPNGNSFNPIDFVTIDVIENGLKEAGFDGVYDLQDVFVCLSVQGYVPNNILKEITAFDSLVDGSAIKEINISSYYPTKYTFVLYNDFDKKMSKNDVSKILEKIVKAYVESFYEFYNINYDSDDVDLTLSKSEDDYVYQLQSYITKFDILKEYSKDLYDRHPDYNLNGLSFNDIVLKCDTLDKNDISKLNYSISYNALSKDSDGLKKYYTYKIKDLTYKLNEYTDDKTEIHNILTSYTKDSTIYITSGDSVIQVDSNSKETYDSLLDKEISLANEISEINRKIEDYQNRIDDIDAATAGDAEKALVENNLVKLGNEYNALLNSFNELVEGYNEKYITNNTISNSSVEYHSNSIISGSFIVQCIKSVGPLFMVTLLVILSIEFVGEIKKRKYNK